MDVEFQEGEISIINMKLKHTYENLIIENYKKFTMMIIYYSGVFEGTINSSFVLDKNP